MAGTLTISTLSDGTNSTSATNPIKGSARAWVNFDGTTASLNGSYNVSSVTRNSSGDFTINFTNAFPNIYYVGVFGPVTRSGPDSNAMVRYSNSMGTYPQTTTTYRVGTSTIGAGYIATDVIAVEGAFFSA